MGVQGWNRASEVAPMAEAVLYVERWFVGLLEVLVQCGPCGVDQWYHAQAETPAS